MIDRSIFGILPDGRTVEAITIEGPRLRAVILTHGARLHALSLDGSPSLVAGSPDLAGYLGKSVYSGPIVAPVINRIAGAEAEVAGKRHRFKANQDARHSLHSGEGTQSMLWSVEQSGKDGVSLSVALADGEGGFPGNRVIRASYRIEGADLRLDITASSDAETLMNPGHHGVWNLDGTADWSGHRLEVAAERYLPVDRDTLPTGEIAQVAGTPYDHRAARTPDPTLDHNFCFEPASTPRFLARLNGTSGRFVEVHSDAPGLQVYAGGSQGIALEPQLWPDAPHHPEFPSILLRAGGRYRQSSLFRLGAV